jgi:polar amino acid transport system permease protein
VALGFMLNNSSYFAEVFRAGIESRAARPDGSRASTGLAPQASCATWIVPQATRNVLPDLVGNGIEVIKLTTIASVVALPEMLRRARCAVAALQPHAHRAGRADVPGAAVAAGALAGRLEKRQRRAQPKAA